MIITENTRLKDIDNAPEFLQVRGNLISGGSDFFSSGKSDMTLKELQEQNPTWNCNDIIFGLNRFQELTGNSGQYVYQIYSNDEVGKNPHLKQTKLLYLPAEKKKTGTFAVLLAGGAYGAVCTMIESLPVAAKLNELGVTCFCLNYRTAVQESFATGLMPKPLDDLAAALKFIESRYEVFKVDINDHFVGGFSAGGHCSAMWGTRHLGFRKYGLPEPKMIMLIYPLLSMENLPSGQMAEYIKQGLFGAGYSDDDILNYAANRHIDTVYPKVFMLRCDDDNMIPSEDTEEMQTALSKAGILNRIERFAKGGHGFGLGASTDAKGWVERAVSFLMTD